MGSGNRDRSWAPPKTVVVIANRPPVAERGRADRRRPRPAVWSGCRAPGTSCPRCRKPFSAAGYTASVGTERKRDCKGEGVSVAAKVSFGRRGGAGRRQRRRTGRAVPDAAAIRRLLLAWYARAGRDLPWRRSRNPYRVWVSEIMLQQTQVERVKEFFARFMARFPTVESLAAADEQEVLGLWEGLGYYRRARQLHAAAGRIVAEHAGSLPRSVQELRRLPGIGRYTAGAIASIAMDLPEPIVEANSRRV
ncbi:MAG: A/G-specific adenine glycosylase, partial [Planctomycetia bacterium]|nr:A/G-specific adenine glycosylase [Planctomycetia bacterium]